MTRPSLLEQLSRLKHGKHGYYEAVKLCNCGALPKFLYIAFTVDNSLHIDYEVVFLCSDCYDKRKSFNL